MLPVCGQVRSKPTPHHLLERNGYDILAGANCQSGYRPGPELVDPEPRRARDIDQLSEIIRDGHRFERAHIGAACVS